MTDLIVPELVLLDVDLGPTKFDTIHALAGLVAAAGRADAAGLEADAVAREEKSPTGLGEGIAIPHCRSAAVNTNSLAFARLNPPVDFGGYDGPADIAFMIAASDGADDAHLALLALLARNLMREDFLKGIRTATTPEEIVAIVNKAIHPEDEDAPVSTPAPAKEADSSDDVPDAAPVKLLAITACPTGIAHTFMAADALEQAAKAAGVQLTVEPQGSGAVTWFTQAAIDEADAIILATDVGVREKQRFAGLPVIESGVKRAINEPKKMIEEAVAAAGNPNARKVSGEATASSASSDGPKLGWGKRIQQAVMTGVSYMIPFIAAGGLLIALAFALGGYNITDDAAKVVAENSLWNLPAAGLLHYLGAVAFVIGAAGMSFLVPALSGFIGFGLAGRPGIAPGFIGGAISVAVGAGFIGGLFTGLIAGFVALWLGSYKVPRWLAGLMPVVIIPLIATLITGAAMLLLLGRPIAAFMAWLTAGLTAMSGSGSAVLLGVVLGLMMCFDLGGPVNKSAYLFATAGLAAATAASYEIMAAVMLAGMVPPLAMALSSAVRPGLYSEAERENGRSAWLLGASFISEGAIPFAAADPFRVIPSMMLGGAVTGALSMALHVGSRAPHGGLFVWFAIINLAWFFVALLAGVLVAAGSVTVLKQVHANKVTVATAS